MAEETSGIFRRQDQQDVGIGGGGGGGGSGGGGKQQRKQQRKKNRKKKKQLQQQQQQQQKQYVSSDEDYVSTAERAADAAAKVVEVDNNTYDSLSSTEVMSSYTASTEIMTSMNNMSDSSKLLLLPSFSPEQQQQQQQRLMVEGKMSFSSAGDDSVPSLIEEDSVVKKKTKTGGVGRGSSSSSNGSRPKHSRKNSSKKGPDRHGGGGGGGSSEQDEEQQKSMKASSSDIDGKSESGGLEAAAEGVDDAPSTPPATPSNYPEDDPTDTTPYLPHLSPSDGTAASSVGGSTAGDSISLPRLSVRTSYLNSGRPRRGRIVSLDRGRSDHAAGLLYQDDETGYQSNDSASFHTDGGLAIGRHHNLRIRRSYEDFDRHQFSSSDGNNDNDNDNHSSGNNNNDKNARPYNYGYDDDDDSYSDDDSSYFAKHLPSPKSASGRSFSLSSTASAPARTDLFRLTKQESDASLSFSDESDDDAQYHQRHRSDGNFPDPNSQPVDSKQQQQQQQRSIVMDRGSSTVQAQVGHQSAVPNDNRNNSSQLRKQNKAVVEMDLYPQRITRMHSVSSLVSDDDIEDDDSQYTEDFDDGGSRASTGASSAISSIATASAASGVVISDDAMEAAAAAGKAMARSGGIASPDYYPPSIMAQSSAPPIHDGILGLADNHESSSHQQAHPQSLSNEQMMSWMAAASATRPSHLSAPLGLAAPKQAFQQQSLPSYSIPGTNQTQRYGLENPNDSNLSSSTSAGIPLVYSDDEDQTNPNYYAMTIAASSSSLPGMKQASNFGSTGNGIPSSGGPGGGGGSFGPGQRNEPSLNPDSTNNVGQRNGESSSDAAIAAAESSDIEKQGDGAVSGRETFKVYWQRWIMLFYMSFLNLLSDWTCYSVAPISLLTEEAFGNIDPERLVVVFLGANAISTACEPIILARLGLRRTVLLGALLLMIGSIVKSGGLPPIIPPNLEKGHAEISLYLGFFLVGLSQPLYQCTPALLSASWFPEKERTMATGVALNANQLGIGFAFIFGTLLVAKADDIPGYFGLLSQIATLVFIGTLIQFDDAPPTPPSSSARAMRGDFRMPRVGSIVGAVRSNITRSVRALSDADEGPPANAPSPASNFAVGQKRQTGRSRRSTTRSSSGRKANATRRRSNASSRSSNAITENGLSAPSSAHYGSTMDAIEKAARTKAELSDLAAAAAAAAEAPSPAPMADSNRLRQQSDQEDDRGRADQSTFGQAQGGGGMPPTMPVGPFGYGYPPPPYQYPPYYVDPRYQQQQFAPQYFPQPYYQQQQVPGMAGMGQPGAPPPSQPGQPSYPPYYPPGQPMPQPYMQPQFPPALQEFDPYYMYGADPYDDGAEPIVNVTDHHLDINIRDDQVIRSLHACMTRKGFSHALAAFTVSGIVINTLSTFMDYLVRLNGAPRTYTGIVGGTFQFVIMISSLVIGKQTDKTRAYYSVTIAMLVLGAFGLAECGVSLDSDRGSDLRWSLVVVAALVGPLQPVSTELGVEVAYPLSENTVLVIQQLFSNLLSAIFIPFFKSLKDIGSTRIVDGEVVQHPDYTFSFYLLIVLHTGVTVYFATFNGSYLRYEHELEKKEKEDREDAELEASRAVPVHPFFTAPAAAGASSGQPAPTGEQQPLLQNSNVMVL